MSRLRAGLPVAALLIMVLSTAGCVPASPDTDTYQDAAVQTIGTAVSEVATVEQLLRMLADDRISRPAAVTGLRDSQQGLDAASGWFTSLTPPVGSDALADRLGTLLDDAARLVSLARTAVHRDRAADYPGLADRLRRLGGDLERLEGRLS